MEGTPPLPSDGQSPRLPDGYRPVEALARHGNRLVLRCVKEDEPGTGVVLKCLLPSAEGFDEDLEAFRAEFLLLDALAHPNWVRPRRFGRLPLAGWFLELEECPGAPIPRWPLRGWWPENLAIARQILSGLEALHRLGYAQLDLSPSQVLVSPVVEESRTWAAAPAPDAAAIRAVLLDLGLAAPFHSPVRGRGTPGYMAPELLRGATEWDGRTDIYAAGSLLFDLFVGEPAFPGASTREIVARQLDGDVPDPGPEAGLPPPVRSLLRELLSPDPNQRPTSALEVWQRLREQAPREQANAFPALLEPGRTFVFQGRQKETAAFTGWLTGWGGAGGPAGGAGARDGARDGTRDPMPPRAASGARPTGAEGPGRLRCRVIGEPGIGRRRLTGRLASVAQTLGWALATTPAPGIPAAWPEAPSGADRPGHGDVAGGSVSRVTELRTIAPEGAGGLILSIEPELDSPEPPLRTRTAIETSGDGRTLTLRLGPLDLPELESALQGQGMESPLLRRVLAHHAVGSPGRLEELWERIPPELDLSSRYAQEESIPESLEEIPPPDGWHRQAAQLMAAAPPWARAEAVGLALQAAEELPGALGAVSGRPSGEIESALEPLRARGYLVGELGAPRFVSSLWARSVLAAAPEESRQVGGGMLARLLASGRPEETVAAARLAIRLADLASLGTSLAPAVAHLVESGRYEDAVALWTSACRAGLAGEKLYERRTALALLEVSLPYPASCGLLLPAPEEMPKPGDVQECANLLAGWAAWARREHRTAEEALAAPCSERLLEFYRRWLRFRGELVREDTATAQAELQGLFAMEMSEARLVFWRRFGESVLLRNCGRPEEARDISEALMSEQGRLRGAERAQVLHHRASLEFQRGAVEEAVPFLEDAVRLFAALRIRRGGLHAANLLGGVQAQRGDLLRAQASFLELAWRRAQTRDWSAWTTALNNLVLTFVEFGRLGEALQTAAGACSVAERASEPAMLARASQKRIYALLAGGFVRRAHEEGARLLVEGSPTPQTRRLARVCTAEAGILLGETNGARAEFQAVVDDFLAAGSREDAQETLVQWALRES